MFYSDASQDQLLDLIKPVVVVEGHFFKPNKIHPPTHYLYRLPWTDDMFVLDNIFLESRTTLFQHRFLHLEADVVAEIMRRLENGMKTQALNKVFHSGITYNKEQDIAVVTGTYINAIIHEYWVDHPEKIPNYAFAAEICHN